jgi:beta-phosphoglucomutase-like phosphatase (HAD superfamily)
MASDLTALIHRDHEELDRTLMAVLAPATPIGDIEELLDALRIGLGAHASAERAILCDLLGPVASSRAVADIVRGILDEHRRQAAALAALAAARVGTSAWRDGALELRIALLDHASREELIGATLFEYIGPERRRALARAYATERLRRFAFVDVVPVRPPLPAVSFN